MREQFFTCEGSDPQVILALGLSALFERLRVPIDCRLERCVSQEFLHNFSVHTQRLDEESKRVPFAVPEPSVRPADPVPDRAF
jgi:hypothetical protein